MTDPEVLEQLSERIDELEKRIIRLEHRSLPAAAEVIHAPILTPMVSADPAAGSAAASQLSESLTLMGKALLGIAGAYLLRAIAASGSVPRAIVTPIAIAYAIAWLLIAARSGSRQRFAGVLYSTTSILILAPMLWEMCLRFQAMSATIAALVLAIYVAMTEALSRSARYTAGLTAAYAGSALTALVLSIATRQMAPFTVLLLAMVLLAEFARIQNRKFAVANVIFFAVDLAVWSLIFIYRAPAESRPEYPALNPALVLAAPIFLFAIHLTGMALHSLAKQRIITILEALQAMIAFSLLACGFMWFTPAATGHLLLGIVCATLAGVCYSLVLGPFRASGIPRNSRILAAWGLALVLGSAFLLLSISAASLALAILAATAMLTERWLRYITLKSHGAVFLAVAAFTSGTLEYALHGFVGQLPPAPSLAVIGVSALAILAYAICHETPCERTMDQVTHFIAAFLAACAASALLIQVLVGVAASILIPTAFHVALLRTIALCTIASVLALGGARLHRIAMTRMAYVLVVFSTAKLLFEDLRHGRLEFAAGSICLVALTFILIPRIAGRTSLRKSIS